MPLEFSLCVALEDAGEHQQLRPSGILGPEGQKLKNQGTQTVMDNEIR